MYISDFLKSLSNPVSLDSAEMDSSEMDSSDTDSACVDSSLSVVTVNPGGLNRKWHLQFVM